MHWTFMQESDSTAACPQRDDLFAAEDVKTEKERK